MKNLLTRYHPHYVRALIYMLQANEYYPFEYLAWYHRTSDFWNIEKRKHLVYTTKAILLSAFAWFSVVFGAISSALVAWQTGLPGFLAAIVGFVLAPFIVPYTLFLLILALNALQKPLEASIIAQAKRTLKKHPAIKIGIAGSFGKTSMREILKTVLSQGKRTASPGGSHNTPLAIARFVRSLSGNEEVLIFEFGEYYPGDIKKLCKFVEPDWGIIAAAADIASRLGLSPEQIQRGISHTKPFEHRMQPRIDGGVTWIDDSYNGNPDGAAAAIEFLKTLKGQRRWYITPGLVEMGSRKEEIHREMGSRLAAAGIEKVVLIRDSVTPYIEQGLKDANYRGEIIWFDFGPTAFNALPKMTIAGDVVLIQNDWPDQYA